MGLINVTLTAQWSANPTHTVTSPMVAAGTPTQAPVSEGASFTVAANGLQHAGFTFLPWNDGANPYAAGSTYTMGLINVTALAPLPSGVRYRTTP